VQELVQNIVCRRVDNIAGARHPSRTVGMRALRKAMTGRRVARLLAAIAVVVAVGAALWFATRPPPLTVQGEVDAHRAA
jgi:hypothetical protein